MTHWVPTILRILLIAAAVAIVITMADNLTSLVRPLNAEIEELVQPPSNVPITK